MASGDGKAPDLPRGLVDRRGAPAGKAARLPSLRAARDLTLGGVPKKVFAPNIPVRREKSVIKEESKDQPDGPQGSGRSKEQHTKGRGRGRGRNGGRGRGRGRGEDNLIQIHSLFEQGPSAQGNKGWGKNHDDGGGNGSGGGGGSRGGSGPRFKTEHPHHAAEKSRHSLENLMRDSFIVDGPGEDPNMMPVTMPMYAPFIKTEVKKEERSSDSGDFGMKEEIKSERDDSPSTSDAKQFNSSLRDLSTPIVNSEMITCADILKRATSSDKEEMVFIQLPVVLPGVPASQEEDPASIGVSKKDDSSEKDKAPVQCSLRNFSEGYLGKLRVRKSGKTELVLGNTVLNVSMGVPSSFLQEVVSIRTDEDNRHMTMLGHVKQKMIITPDFEALLKAKAAENT